MVGTVRHLAGLIGALVLLGACSANRTPTGQPAEPETYDEEVRTLAGQASDSPLKVIRFNPVSCQCPPFEIQLGARWVRLLVNGTEEPQSPAGLLATEAAADLAAGRIEHYRVEGELSTSPQRCAQGALYLTLALESAE